MYLVTRYHTHSYITCIVLWLEQKFTVQFFFSAKWRSACGTQLQTPIVYRFILKKSLYQEQIQKNESKNRPSVVFAPNQLLKAVREANAKTLRNSSIIIVGELINSDSNYNCFIIERFATLNKNKEVPQHGGDAWAFTQISSPCIVSASGLKPTLQCGVNHGTTQIPPGRQN